VTEDFFITVDIFDRWQNGTSFVQDMQSYVKILGERTNLKIKADKPALTEANSYWKHACECWLKELTDSTDISHLKKCAALFSQLYHSEPFSIEEELPIQPGIDEYTRDSILSSGGHYIAWSLIYEICDHFEANRVDRIQPYVSRLDDEFAHDFMVCVKRGHMHERSIRLVLKALFIRDPKPQ